MLRTLVLVLMGCALSPALAHVNSGANCASCHSSSRSGMTLTGHGSTADLGAGVGKVFQVKPGQTVSLEARREPLSPWTVAGEVPGNGNVQRLSAAAAGPTAVYRVRVD